MVDGEMRALPGGGDAGQGAEDAATAPEPTSGPLEEARLAFTSRLASFGLGEATERLLEAGGILPAGRRARGPSPIRDDLRLG